MPLGRAKVVFEASLPSLLPPEPPRSQKGADARTSPEERLNVWGESRAGEVRSGPMQPEVGGAERLEHGSIVIAAITELTNTSTLPSCWRPGSSPRKRSRDRLKPGGDHAMRRYGLLVQRSAAA